MARGLAKTAAKVKAAGRFGDTELAHLSPDEIAILSAWQGDVSINPETGLPEFFKLGKVLKSVAKAAGALAGAYLGGPAGAAIGGGLTAKLLGDSTKNALVTGALSGLGAYGVQQTGIGDSLGIDALGSGADLLGRAGTDAAAGAASGSGKGISAALPLLGLGTAALAAGAPKAPKPAKSPTQPDVPLQEYEPLDRERREPAGDPYDYGQFGPEGTFFNEVNPTLKPIAMRRGGRVYFKYGGNVSEGGKKEGARDAGGQGPNAGNRGGSDRSASVTGNRFGAPSQSAVDAKKVRDASVRNFRDPSGSATVADKVIRDRYIATPAEKVRSDADYWSGVGNLGRAYGDFKDYGNSTLDNIGNALAGIVGIGEINPLTQGLGARTKNPNASWGVDPIGAVLGAGGLAGITPFGLGAAYSGAKKLSGYQGPMISFDEYDPISQEESASDYHWSQEGIFGGIADKLGLNGGVNSPAPGGTGRDTMRGVDPAIPTMPKSMAQSGQQPTDLVETEDPNVPGGRIYVPLGDIFSYGQASPEHAFFSGELAPGDYEVNMARGGGVKGPGTGQSDDIPAMLSNDEHVIDAETVAMIGDGSSDAGHKRIEQMKRKVRAKKRKAKPSKIPPKLGSLSRYLKEAA